MGELKKGSPLRIFAMENGGTNSVAVMIHRKRLPGGVSFEEVRKSLIVEVKKMVRSKFPYSYWVSPKANSWLND